MIRIMMVMAKSPDDLSATERQIIELLRQRHHIAAKRDDDFSVRNLTQIIQTAEQSTKVMRLLLGAIASVSLLIGGIIGIIMGVFGALLLSELAGWQTIVSLLSVLMAFRFSGLVGILFGFYPAYKASRLDPIDALRYE